MFKIILFCFGILIKMLYMIASVMDSDFRKRLNERNISIVIKTKDGKKARQFLLKEGNIYSYGKDHPDPDISIAVLSPLSAYLMFLRPTPKLMIKSMFNAVINNKIKIDFKIEPSVWFMMTFSQMMNVFMNKSSKA